MKYCERCGYPIRDHNGSVDVELTPDRCLRVLGAHIRVLEAKLLEHLKEASYASA